MNKGFIKVSLPIVSTVLVTTLVALNTVNLPASANNNDQCGQVFTYEKSGDFNDNRVNINFENSDEQIDVSADSGYQITEVALDVENDGHSGFWVYANGPVNNFNPNPGGDISEARVKVQKVCPSPTPSPSPSPTATPSPSASPSPSVSPSPSLSPTPSPTPSPSVSPSPSPSTSPSPSVSPSPSPSSTPSATPSASPDPSPTPSTSTGGGDNNSSAQVGSATTTSTPEVLAATGSAPIQVATVGFGMILAGLWQAKNLGANKKSK